MTEPIVKVSGLTCYIGGFAVVDGVSFSVSPGEVFALVGPNGAGKTTLMRMLLGMLEPTRGAATLFGCSCRALTPEVRAQIGYLVEGHPLYGWMNIRQLAELTSGTHPRWSGRRFRASLDYFGLDEGRQVQSLSNGQRAQVSLALTLACDPDLLVMDDPALGIDSAARRDFLRSIVDLVTREGRAVIMSTHVLADIERVADRIGVMVEGKLRVDAPLETFKSSVVKYHLTFAGAPPAALPVPRSVNVNVVNADVEITVVHPGPDTTRALDELGAIRWEQVPMSLEDAFVDYTAGRERRTRFDATAFMAGS
jgi:ABC-2 type transport system ATP-binding protein